MRRKAKKVKKRLYGIKAILKSTIIEDKEYESYEEMIVTVKAKSKKKAYKKAKKYIKGYCKDYINANNETVQTQIYFLSDAFEAFKKEKGVREIYSKIHLNLENE